MPLADVGYPGGRDRSITGDEPSQLQAKWRSALKQPAPPHLRKQLLVPMLAYKLQEQAFGGLSPTLKRRLRELANRFDRNPKQTAKTLSQSACRDQAGNTIDSQMGR